MGQIIGVGVNVSDHVEGRIALMTAVSTYAGATTVEQVASILIILFKHTHK